MKCKLKICFLSLQRGKIINTPTSLLCHPLWLVCCWHAKIWLEKIPGQGIVCKQAYYKMFDNTIFIHFMYKWKASGLYLSVVVAVQGMDKKRNFPLVITAAHQATSIPITAWAIEWITCCGWIILLIRANREQWIEGTTEKWRKQH